MVTRGGVVTAIVVLSGLLGGCTGDTQEAPDRDASTPAAAQSNSSERTAPPAGLPSWTPLRESTPAKSSPRGITDELDLAAATGDPRRSRLGGEQFALDAVAVLMDARLTEPVQDVIDELAAGELDAKIEDFLTVELKAQRDLGAQRHLDAGLDQWLRSDVSGSAADPERIDVEIAANLVSEPIDFHTWYRFRVGVEWRDSRWALVDFNAADQGPYTGENLTPAEQQKSLVGDDWRRIPARQ